MKNGRTIMIKRFFALVMAFAVAVSILTVPVQESYAAGGKVKSACKTTDTQKRENIYLEIKGNRNRKSFKEGYL
mgnify:CR=1 FL=1